MTESAAVPQAQRQPYDLPPEFAAKAHEIFDEMVSRGIKPEQIHYHTLMDCQVCSSMLHESHSHMCMQHASRWLVHRD